MIAEKITTRDLLVSLCDRWRREKKTIGFTSGAFDLLHAGHVDYLERAKAMCDCLIVGVNSDASVRKYKGPDRPIVAAEHRVRLLAALESVDYVFLFDERRNQVNIEKLRPDLYIKAGDYSTRTLTSREAVESYGGAIRLIPVEYDLSTTDIVNKITTTVGISSEGVVRHGNTESIQRRPRKPGPAVFLDRDGTINEEILYLHDPAKFKLLPYACEGIRRFQDMGYRLVIMTNQPGIGMGYYTEEDFYSVNLEMLRQLSQRGIRIDRIYFCPHSKAEKCDCRKPEQALVQRARDSLNLDLSRSVFIGDKTSDIETGRRAGMRTIGVETGMGCRDGEYPADPDRYVANLVDAAEEILQMERG